MEDILLRRAFLADAAVLPDVERSADAVFRGVPGLEWIADDAVLGVEAQRRWIRRGHVWVAEQAGRGILGFVTAQEVEDLFHIWQIAVRAEAQRAGIGRALIARVEAAALAAGRSALTLTTFRALAFNEAFYAGLGFRVLRPSECRGRLAGILRAEAEHGLPAERRCAMRRDLGTPDRSRAEPHAT